jgi:hypothetical protein
MRNVVKTRLLVLFLIFGFISCKPNYEEIFMENNQKFDQNRIILNQLIDKIENTYLKKYDRRIGLKIEVDTLDKITKKKFENLGIGNIEITGNPKDDCAKKYWIPLNIVEGWNISTLKKVQLIFAPCDSNGEKKDRNKRENYNAHQDFWGQGENWFIYSDTDEY